MQSMRATYNSHLPFIISQVKFIFKTKTAIRCHRFSVKMERCSYGSHKFWWFNSLSIRSNTEYVHPSCSLYASANYATFGLDNGLAPRIRRQTSIWTNVVTLLIEPFGMNFDEIWIKCKHFHSQNVFQYIVFNWASVLSRFNVFKYKQSYPVIIPSVKARQFSGKWDCFHFDYFLILIYVLVARRFHSKFCNVVPRELSVLPELTFTTFTALKNNLVPSGLIVR